MHYAVIVVTDDKPTDKVLAQVLAPHEGVHWDWYQVGGRYTGWMSGGTYRPDEDPANIEQCQQCGGSGRRNDERGRQLREADPSYTCNGCQGAGQSVKWPTEWVPYAGDHCQVSALPVALRPPYAMVVGGEWVEKDEAYQRLGFNHFMAQPDDRKADMREQADAAWVRRFGGIRANLRPGQWVTIVDCHN